MIGEIPEMTKLFRFIEIRLALRHRYDEKLISSTQHKDRIKLIRLEAEALRSIGTIDLVSIVELADSNLKPPVVSLPQPRLRCSTEHSSELERGNLNCLTLKSRSCITT